MAMATALLCLLLVAPAAHAVTHIVGDKGGWSLTENYQTWAAGRNFTVNDNLVFTYDKTHRVDVVNRDDYNECDSGDAIQTYSDGNTTIRLENPGMMYFICPTSGHCLGGMKLAVNVQAASITPGASPTPTTPPSSGGTPSPTTPTSGRAPPTTPGTTTPPPLQPPSGATTLSAKGMLVLSAALAAMVAFMS